MFYVLTFASVDPTDKMTIYLFDIKGVNIGIILQNSDA